MPKKLITFAELIESSEVQISRTQAYRYIEDGVFPKPIVKNDNRYWTPLHASFLKQFFKDLKLQKTFLKEPKVGGRVLSIFNQKGGVGKTGTAINLGASLATMGKRVLLVDCDPQASLSLHLGLKNYDPDYYFAAEEMPHPLDIADVVFRNIKPEDVITPVPFVFNNEDYSMDVMRSGPAWAEADRRLAEEYLKHCFILECITKPMELYYDFIILDCPPSLGLTPINALFASDDLIIPITPSNYALDGIVQLFKTINILQGGILKHPIFLAGVLITDRTKTIIQDKLVEDIDFLFGHKVFHTRIDHRTSVQQAEHVQKNILAHDPGGDVSQAFLELAKEYLNRVVGGRNE